MATVAMFIALGGSSYAALNLPKNAVGAAQLKANSVRASEVKNRSLGLGEFKSSARAGLRGAEGPRGLQGLQGLKGDKGDKGDVGPTQGFALAAQAGALPSSTPEFTNATQIITTTTTGRLYVVGRASVGTSCAAGAPEIALYVDGAPVPASGYEYGNAEPAARITTFGVSEPVPAGEHTVTLRTDCQGGSFNTGSTSNAALAAVLLGGS